ncbi:MAG: ABC transporter substrate-binding protein [Planctomycetes bacterium]|nr:ABC transporter substrate-binding protein [Planctomycetota bacterium]
MLRFSSASLVWSCLLVCASFVPAQVPPSDDLAAPIRVALRARLGAADRLTPLRYLGGFETKTLVYETLVRRGPDGRLEPALANWQIAADGRSFRFTVRPGATFQDGTAVTADAIATHFRRWVGLPEHDWLPANRRIREVTVDGADTFTVRLDEPYPLLGDLAAINPCAIVAPAARDWEGEFQRPLGSGPFRFLGTTPAGQWRFQGRDAAAPILEVHPFPRSNLDPSQNEAPLDALVAGRLDVFVGGWDEDLPAARLDAFANDPRFVVQAVPGSSVVYLSFRLLDGPTADVEVRRRIARALDRQALVATCEGGRADPCTAWAAPSVRFWPRRPAVTTAAPDPTAPRLALRIAAARLNPRALRVARAVAGQLAPHGFDVDVVTFDPRPEAAATLQEPGTVKPLSIESGAVRAAANRSLQRAAETADLCVEITHGLPYDPQLTLVSRWGGFENHNEDEPRPEIGVDAELQALVRETLAIADEVRCVPVYAQIQARMDEQALLVPLYAPHHLAIHAADVDGVALGPDLYRVDLTRLRRVAHLR